MKLAYLNNNSWAEITREERYYCAELFFFFKKQPLNLIKLLLKTKSISCLGDDDLKSDWELGYEVCFYRDLINNINLGREHKIKIDDYNRKRTFDLCLFSKSKILIIEAKVQSGFNSVQMKDFKKDETHFEKLIKDEGIKFPKIYLIGLASKKYFSNVQKPGKKGISDLIKKNYFTWMDLYNEYPNEVIFKTANDRYKK